MRDKHLLMLVCLFFVAVIVSFSMYPSPLVDDIMHYLDVINLNQGKDTNYEVMRVLFNDDSRITRPMSPILLGSIILISQIFPPMFFAWGIGYVGIVYLLYKILNKYFGNTWLSVLICTMVLLFPLSSTSIFSPVMQTGQYAIYMFLISLLLADKKPMYNYVIIGFCTLTTMLFYEMNFFVYPLLFLLIWVYNKNDRRILKLFLAFVVPIILALIYKRIFAKMIFEEAFSDYSVKKFVLDFNRIKKVPFAIFRTFFLDWGYIIVKSFKNIQFYSVSDVVLLVFGGIISVFIAIKTRVQQKISKKYIVLFILLLFSTLSIYCISIYSLSAFTYDNRILFWVRFVSMILLGMVLNNAFHYIKEKKGFYFLSKILLGVFVFSFFVIIISQKNSWISATEYDKKVILNLQEYFPNNQNNIRILYVRDKKNRENLITEETPLREDYTLRSAQRIYTQSNFDPKKIIFYNPDAYPLYSIGSKGFHEQYPPFTKAYHLGAQIAKVKIKYPFYIFDERDNSILKVNNKQDFKIR